MVKVIETDEEYELALTAASALMDCEVDTPEADELMDLAEAINAYEDQRWPIPKPTAEEAAAFRAEQEHG